GALVAWLGRGGDSLLTFFPADEGARAAAATALANALAGLVASGERRAVLLSTIDSEPAARSGLGAALYAAGFRATHEGWQRRRSDATVSAAGRPSPALASETDDETHA
ncbi:MAG: hypothetical protein M3O36_01245, partial [Myxococcota bacterium]|nr:hypothetical protein [Myxococcota bacterium]